MLLKSLFKSIVALFISVLCVGGGTAISIVSMVRSSGEGLYMGVAVGVFLAIFGGYALLLVSSFQPRIRVSSHLKGVSFAFGQPTSSSHQEISEPAVRSLFSVIAAVIGGLLCSMSGIAVVIVAIAKGNPAGLPIPALVGGFVQAVFGGYIVLLASGSRPAIKASSDLKEGISLELDGQ